MLADITTKQPGVSEISDAVRVEDGGTDEKTGGGDGGCRVEDVTNLV